MQANYEPFLLEIEDVLNTKRPNEVGVMGRVVRGSVGVDEPVEIVGFAPQVKPAVVTAITTVITLPLYVLRGVSVHEIHRGHVIATPGTIAPATTFWAEVVFDERYEKIRQQPDHGLCRYTFYIRHADIFGALHLPAGKDLIVHDDRFQAKIVLTQPSALEVGLSFGIGKLLGQGAVQEILG